MDHKDKANRAMSQDRVRLACLRVIPLRLEITWSGQNRRYSLIIRTGELMARRNDDAEGSYDQVRRLRRGWQLWAGDGWAEVQSTAVRDDSVMVTVTDGRVFRVNYLEAVLCRRPAPGRLIGSPRHC
jgi:hypothetical protein